LHQAAREVFMLNNPLPEIAELVRIKVSSGEVVDVDSVVAIAQPYYKQYSSQQLKDMVLAIVVHAGGNAKWGDPT
jgi:hypothetical protein